MSSFKSLVSSCLHRKGNSLAAFFRFPRGGFCYSPSSKWAAKCWVILYTVSFQKPALPLYPVFLSPSMDFVIRVQLCRSILSVLLGAHAYVADEDIFRLFITSLGQWASIWTFISPEFLLSLFNGCYYLPAFEKTLTWGMTKLYFGAFSAPASDLNPSFCSESEVRLAVITAGMFW